MKKPGNITQIVPVGHKNHALGGDNRDNRHSRESRNSKDCMMITHSSYLGRRDTQGKMRERDGEQTQEVKKLKNEKCNYHVFFSSVTDSIKCSALLTSFCMHLFYKEQAQ